MIINVIWAFAGVIAVMIFLALLERKVSKKKTKVVKVEKTASVTKGSNVKDTQVLV